MERNRTAISAGNSNRLTPRRLLFLSFQRRLESMLHNFNEPPLFSSCGTFKRSLWVLNVTTTQTPTSQKPLSQKTVGCETLFFHTRYSSAYKKPKGRHDVASPAGRGQRNKKQTPLPKTYRARAAGGIEWFCFLHHTNFPDRQNPFPLILLWFTEPFQDKSCQPLRH